MTPTAFRKLREDAGLSIQAFAIKTGVAYATIKRFEDGESVRSDAQARLERGYDLLAGRRDRKPTPTQTGHALRGIRPGAVEPGDPAAAWNGRFDVAWPRDQVRAWARGLRVTLIEMKTTEPESPTRTGILATEAQLMDLGRRIGLAMTGKMLQE